MSSSDDDAVVRLPFMIWCMACGHAMRSAAHGNRHCRCCSQNFGYLCGCCGATLLWRPLNAHLNQAGVYRRVPQWHTAPIPLSDRPNRCCRQAETDGGSRYHPYVRSPTSSVSSAAGCVSRNHFIQWHTWKLSQWILSIPFQCQFTYLLMEVQTSF